MPTIDPSKADDFAEDDNDQGDAAGGEAVHQLEDIHATRGDH